jgi:hypothetical protein
VHQSVRQITIGGEKQQAGGVKIEATNGNPPAGFQVGQTPIDSAPPLRIIA